MNILKVFKDDNYISKISWIFLLLLSYLFLTPGISAKEVITDPKYTHDEDKAKQLTLVKVHEIKEDIDDETFMAKPMSFTVDNQGNIFIYDAGQTCIFKFDKNYRFIKTFGSQGQGPGEFNGLDSGSFKLYFSDHENKLYAEDSFNHKIVVFDTDGNLIKDIRTPTGQYFPQSYLLRVDANGNLYINSRRGGAVDVYNKNLEYIQTFLKESDYNRFLLYEPVYDLPRKDPKRNTMSLPGSTLFDLTNNNDLIICLNNSSTAFIIQNKKLKKQFDIWPKNLLIKYREEYSKMKKWNLKNTRIDMIMDVFIDHDNDEFFYITGFWGYDKIYKYNLNGQLIAVLHSSIPCQFSFKKNHYFYGLLRTTYQTLFLVFKEKELNVR